MQINNILHFFQYHFLFMSYGRKCCVKPLKTVVILAIPSRRTCIFLFFLVESFIIYHFEGLFMQIQNIFVFFIFSLFYPCYGEKCYVELQKPQVIHANVCKIHCQDLHFFLIFLFEGFATSHFKGNLLKFLNMFRFFIYSLLFLIYNEKCNVKLSKTEVMYATPVARKTISLIFSVEDCTISYFKGLLMQIHYILRFL